MTHAPTIVFDPEKDAANQAKHGLPLAFAAAVIEGSVHDRMDIREDYGEDRFISYGYVSGRLYVAVWTEREDGIRAISVRKANPREQKRYG